MMDVEQELMELEALADMMIERATRIKEFAVKARRAAAGVSTPANAKGIKLAAAAFLAKRDLKRNINTRKIKTK